MKQLLALALVLCLMAPALAAQEEERSPFEIYLNDQTPENFIDAYNAYSAQLGDSADNSAAAMLAWLNYYEIDRMLETLKANEAKLSAMNKFQYANILYELARYDEAIALYEQLNKETPEWSCPWRHKGSAHWKKGRYDEAVKSLKMAIETRESHYDAYVILAKVYTDMKEYKKAASTLETGLSYYGKDSEDPEKYLTNAEVQFMYLDLLRKTGQKEKYREQLAKLRQFAPNDERLKQYK